MAPQSEKLRGIVLMVATIASFTFADLFSGAVNQSPSDG